jgi:hypothetical protein
MNSRPVESLILTPLAVSMMVGSPSVPLAKSFRFVNGMQDARAVELGYAAT